MARRIVRDLDKKGPKTISLKKEKTALSYDPAAFKIVISNQKNVVRLDKKKKKIQDIASNQKPDRIYFFHIDSEDEKKDRRFSDLIRLSTAGVLILLVINLINVYHKGINLTNDVIASAYTGYQGLIQAKTEAENANFGAAEQTFGAATKNFDTALENISFLRTNQDYFLTKERTVESVEGLLDAAKSVSLAGGDFSRGIENLRQLPALFIQENINAASNTNQTGKKSLTELLKEDLQFLDRAAVELEMAQESLSQVSPNVLPPTFRERLNSTKETLANILKSLNEARSKIPAFLDLLGDRYPHRYLILLQNDTEARPTGGFIGSYLIVDLNDGYITKMDFHDVYELDGQLFEKITPPEDIAMVSDTWKMRDSNYSPDFAISAEKAAWFLQKQKGPSVDTVIAINQSFISDLLNLTGPLSISSLKAPLTADNFQIVLSYIIESKLTGLENPKEVLEELIPAFKKKLFSEVSLDRVLFAFIEGYEQKKILLYSRNEKIQKLFDEFGMTGRVIRTKPGEDYLNVTVTSIGGNKSDRYMNQDIAHNTLISSDGKIMDEVSITRRHTWDEKDMEEWKNILKQFGYSDFTDTVLNILGRTNNKAFIKVYVPKGSQLKDVMGMEKSQIMLRTDDEINKDYFMFIMDIMPTTTEKITLTYELPDHLNISPADTYKFFAQSQPAFRHSYLEKRVYFKPGLKSQKEHPSSLKKEEDGSLYYAGGFDSNLYLSTLVAK